MEALALSKRSLDSLGNNSISEDSQADRFKLLKTSEDGSVQRQGLLRREDDNESGGIRCLHEVSIPEGQELPPRKPLPAIPAKKYPFTLDPFQEEAIRCLENGESVLVSAHTSAGKTVVAEYAIAMSLRDQQRVIYTSPIKALSNQKFREMTEEFSDVGLMTGDVTIAPSASCLVMTTEILRSMLYRGSTVTREVGWLIFDEVHYMRDRERGVVWEESIAMAPKNCNFVFLSATVPNAREFSDWVAKIHKKPCHIVYTDFRPTPLEHYIFPSGGSGIHLVLDRYSNFREDNFQKSLAELGGDPLSEFGAKGSKKGSGKGKKGEGGKEGQDGEKSDIFRVVKMVVQRQFEPCIVFAFSKSECERLAKQMAKLDLNDEDERELVEKVFQSATDSLAPEDKRLPQISSILPLLMRGIGIHHSGLLPILKEVIEILFQEGLLKVLFATETFSIGLNMPAKTVVFTSVRKWDGSAHRPLTSGEYVQMSGRAGRRGLDERGLCILMLDSKLEPSVAKGMIRGSADPLNSAFHLSYNMILNQLRSEDSTMDILIQRSFAQFQATRALPQLKSKVLTLESEIEAISIEEGSQVEKFFDQRDQLRQLYQKQRSLLDSPRTALPFLSPGRIVKILCRPFKEDSPLTRDETQGKNFGRDPFFWGIIVNFRKISVKKGSQPGMDDDISESTGPSSNELRFEVDVLARCREEIGQLRGSNGRNRAMANPLEEGEEGGEPLVTAVPLEQLDTITAVRVHLPKDLLSLESRQLAQRTLEETLKRFPEGIPLLDPEEDMQIKGGNYRKISRRIEALESMLNSSPLAKSATLGERLLALQQKRALQAELKTVKREVKSGEGLIMKEELKARKRILRRLGYTNSEDVVQLKGRVACEIAAADEVILTELLFEGTFQELSPAQAAALLSCLIWQEKSYPSPTKLRENLEEPLRQFRDVVRRVAKVCNECKLHVDENEFVESFKPDIMEATFSWCQGAKFGDVLKLTDDVFEGSLIRAFRRLEEVLQQVVVACKAIGETNLEAKFQESIKAMKRGIVFAASLYL